MPTRPQTYNYGKLCTKYSGSGGSVYVVLDTPGTVFFVCPYFQTSFVVCHGEESCADSILPGTNCLNTDGQANFIVCDGDLSYHDQNTFSSVTLPGGRCAYNTIGAGSVRVVGIEAGQMMHERLCSTFSFIWWCGAALVQRMAHAMDR
jgi:hypothetical protein